MHKRIAKIVKAHSRLVPFGWFGQEHSQVGIFHIIQDESGTRIRVAKRKAPGAKLLVGDVTRLAAIDVNGPFELMLDLGCFHSIPDDRRDAYVREVTRVARPGATLLMFAFGEKGSGTPFATEQEVRKRFTTAFEIAEVRPGAPFRKQTWYRLLRKQAD